MTREIPVIDLFAGPGGLGEGFSAFTDPESGGAPFRIALSVENESSAHRTLLLRSVFRHMDAENATEAYYEFLRGNLGAAPEDELYKLQELDSLIEEARHEARNFTLGKSHASVYRAIRERLGSRDCILIGGPPCQAYSMVGRSRNYGDKTRTYIASEDHRNFLYIEYLRIVARFQPLVFVMENVKGMLSAKVDGTSVFDMIRGDLQDPCKTVRTRPEKGRSPHKYRLFSFVVQPGSDLFATEDLQPTDFIIRSEDYGVPQARHRVIILGVREDLVDRGAPRVLDKRQETLGLAQIINDLPRIRSKLSKTSDDDSEWVKTVREFPLEALSGAAADSTIDRIERNLRLVKCPRAGAGAEFGLSRQPSKSVNSELGGWLFDNRLGNSITNHAARGHLAGDLHRYMFASSYGEVFKSSPKYKDFPKKLWPDHKNFGSGRFADRFRVQISGRAASTITSHISKDGHYYIHYDPTQCRSLTVREAARIQTFPDNYFFVGNRTQQYVQVGNAVPPYLARQLAAIVFNTI